MKYAVIQINGKQHRVTEDQILTVDHIDQAEGSTFDVAEVLLVVDGDKQTIGNPLVDKAKVTLSVVSHEKDDKIRVATYKAKSRVRRVYGHRQAITNVKVVSIK